MPNHLHGIIVMYDGDCRGGFQTRPYQTHNTFIMVYRHDDKSYLKKRQGKIGVGSCNHRSISNVRHSRESGNPVLKFRSNRHGFPIKPFGNDVRVATCGRSP